MPGFWVPKVVKLRSIAQEAGCAYGYNPDAMKDKRRGWLCRQATSEMAWIDYKLPEANRAHPVWTS
jgi:hypothetical protein